MKNGNIKNLNEISNEELEKELNRLTEENVKLRQTIFFHIQEKNKEIKEVVTEKDLLDLAKELGYKVTIEADKFISNILDKEEIKQSLIRRIHLIKEIRQ